MIDASPASPKPTVLLNGLPTRRDDLRAGAIGVSLLVVSNRRVIVMAIGCDVARDLVRRLSAFLDNPSRSHETRCALSMSGTVGGKERTVLLSLPRVTAALFAARLDYLSAGTVIRGDANGLDT